MRLPVILFGAAAAALAVASPAAAANHTVKMMNSGPGGAMVFSPALVKVAPGDSVTFVPSNPTHNAESINGMVPPGASPFKGPMSKPLTVKFSKPGVYGYKCTPHYGMGMVGAVVVGSAAPNLAAVQAVSHPGLAKKRFGQILAGAK